MTFTVKEAIDHYSHFLDRHKDTQALQVDVTQFDVLMGFISERVEDADIAVKEAFEKCFQNLAAAISAGGRSLEVSKTELRPLLTFAKERYAAEAQS